MSPTRPPDRGRSAALALSAWPLRRKVALALAVPLLLAGTLGGLRVRADLTEAANSSSSARQVTALRPAVEYLTAAEQAMVAVTSTGADGQAALESALDAVREAGSDLLAAKESADLTADQRYQVDAVLDLSQALRADDAIDLSPDTFVAQLRQLQSGVTRLIATIVQEQITPEPRLELLSQALAGRFSLAMQQALVATERTGETGSLELFSEFGAEGAAIERLASALSASEASVASLRTANAQRFRTVRTGGTDLGGPKAYTAYDRIIGNLQEGIDEELEAAAAQARTDALLNLAITLASLVAAVLLALLVSRLLLNPIRRVREGALAVAHEQLPEAVARIRAGEEPEDITPIDVSTEEEIGQLARAVDDMHRQAVALASREASLREEVSQMFVTLSRRSTTLINQQLGLIERLERDEEDPKRLESLFRLDHLAARMRRTSDSLLILADAPTATAVTDELTVGDALQAATSGVQDYQRVRIRSASPLPIDRSAAADVVHLLTELVDNALTYSPPTSVVTVGSRTVDDGVAIEIADAGLGIAAEDLARINDSLGSGGDVTPDTARRMGLFVVSRLSQRHGLVTSLRSNEQGGTTATVLLPSELLGGRKPREETPTSPTAPGGPKEADVIELTEERAPAQPAVRDVGSLIHATLGLPTPAPAAAAAPGSGAPAPVTPSTAPAALAKLRPLRKDPDPAPQAAGGRPGAAAQPVLRPVADPAPAEGGPAPATAGPAPAAGGPAPATADAAPATAGPAPATAGPAPSTAVPAPAEAGPVPPAAARTDKRGGPNGLPTRTKRATGQSAGPVEPATRGATAKATAEAAAEDAAEATAEATAKATAEAAAEDTAEAAAKKIPEEVKAAPLTKTAENPAATAPVASSTPTTQDESADTLNGVGVPGPAESLDLRTSGATPEPAAAPVTAPVTASVTAPVAAPAVLAPELAAAPAAVAVEATTSAPAAAPASAPRDALGGDWSDPGDDGSETPIFKSLRSAWLSSGKDAQPWRTSEIEQGWEKADKVAESPVAAEVSASGLPVRRPGTRLVPGGVKPTPSAKVRDPEAIRARLAAHASGVSRGRAAATEADPSPKEAGS